VHDGLLHYTHNFVGEESYDVVATTAMPVGSVTVRALFAKTEGESAGVVTLFVGETEVGSGPIPRTVPYTAGLADSFDIGMDLSTPVSDKYETPFKFTGEIESVVINLM
jgi:arylsulfatase